MSWTLLVQVFRRCSELVVRVTVWISFRCCTSSFFQRFQQYEDGKTALLSVMRRHVSVTQRSRAPTVWMKSGGDQHDDLLAVGLLKGLCCCCLFSLCWWSV